MKQGRLIVLLFSLLLLSVLQRVFCAKELPAIGDDSDIGTEKGTIHIVISTECFKSYFIYQSLAMKYSFDKVGQPGNITRVVSCDTPENLKQEDLEIMDSLVVPSWTQHPISGDYYQPYNRPVSILYWLALRRPKAEWTLILDPDMILRRPFTLEEFAPPEGFALSAHYNYLQGSHNALADRHIPDVQQLDDHNGGQRGRRADESGAFMFLRTRDLLRVAPLWLEFTEAVRQDPDAWNLTGDSQLKKGQKAWISEMYGYIFAAAKAGIRHRVETTVQYYPGYLVSDIPYLIHYGLRHSVEQYTFSKHEHFDFDPLSCPPWNMSQDRSTNDDRGLILHPPYPSSVNDWQARKRYGSLLVIEFVNTINKALCERHRRKCSEVIELVEEECRIVDEIEAELNKAYVTLHLPGVICHDSQDLCVLWQSEGSCTDNWLYMSDNCRASCQLCRNYPNASSDDLMPDKRDCLRLGLEHVLEDQGCRLLIEKGLIHGTDFDTYRPLRVVNRDMVEFDAVPYAFIIAAMSFVFCIVLRGILLRGTKKKGYRSRVLD